MSLHITMKYRNFAYTNPHSRLRNFIAMRKILFLFIGVLLLSGNIAATAQTAQNPDMSVAQDSTVDIIGWFAKHDKLEYCIEQSSWRFNGQDTTLISALSTNIRIVVTDSTATGYKMDYTFLDVQADTTTTSPLSKFQNILAEKLGKKIVGTTIQFETDELGAITKFNNLGKIKKQAKSLFKEAMKELFALPEMKPLKELGFDPRDLTKDIDTDQLVDGYLEELKLLFLCHGKSYEIGESRSHEDATDTSYENDTYTTVSLDPEDGSYVISSNVVNIVPKSEVKTLLGEIFKEFTNDNLAENMEQEFDSAVDHDATIESYFASYYMPCGWPYKVVTQSSTMIGNRGKAKQTYIYLTDFSTDNQ